MGAVGPYCVMAGQAIGGRSRSVTRRFTTDFCKVLAAHFGNPLPYDLPSRLFHNNLMQPPTLLRWAHTDYDALMPRLPCRLTRARSSSGTHRAAPRDTFPS